MGCFDIVSRSGFARGGLLRTAHGEVQTPAFMPVATQGSVKGLWPDAVAGTGARMILCNAFHLALRPGADSVSRLGGLHRFISWGGSILTDSGGFQVFSLEALRKISEEGALFRSPVDGAPFMMTPEKSMEIQNLLGADVIMAFDECPALPCEKGKMTASLERTARWLGRCRDAHRRDDQLLFGIVQGGTDPELRALSLDLTEAFGLPGLAIGGLSVGESREERLSVLSALAPRLPADKPRYLMGVGTPLDLLEAVSFGIDMFDCVLPTRDGRHGVAYTDKGRMHLKNASNKEAETPLDPGCGCPCCRSFSRAYLRHLLMAGEHLGSMAVSAHNLHYYQNLMGRARQAVAGGGLQDLIGRIAPAYTNS